MRTRGLTIAAVAVVLASAVAGGVLAAADGSIAATPSDPNEDADHAVTVVADEAAAGTVDRVVVDYGDLAPGVDDLARADVTTIGIDRGGDDPGTAVDEEIGTDLAEVSGEPGRFTLTLDGVTLDAGDELVVVYDGVVNPAAGEYDVTVDLDPVESGGAATATLAIGSTDDSMGDDSSMAGENGSMADEDDSMASENGSMSGEDESMADEDGSMSGEDESMADEDGSMTEEDGSTNEAGATTGAMDGGSGETSAGMPGFGLVAALVVLVGAGVVLVVLRGGSR